MKFAFFAAAFAVSLSASAAAQGANPTLNEVRKNGYLRCGVSDGLTGFSNPDAQGNWSGLDVDFCRAIAAAIFDDPNAVRYTATTAKERFTALTQGRQFEVLSRNTTITMQRDVSLGMDFVGVTYYDGQGFIVKKDAGVTSVDGLSGATICTQTGTTTELNVADYFGARGMQYQILAFDKESEALSAYDGGRCDAYTTDHSGLYAARLELSNADDNIILPEIISKEPLGPAVRQGDPAWEDLVRWVLYALVNAEELGVDSQNIDSLMSTTNPEQRRLLGLDGDFGKSLGLTNDWVIRIVKKVGNYGEIFERNVGMGSALKIERGRNALWTNGGLQYAPPIR
jgi:general L-amino acid transport system substrate-binding protein